jgi:hypothetical protein
MRWLFRRGEEKILEGNVVSVVIGLIVLLGFIFLGVKLYQFVSGVDERNAKAFLDSIDGKIRAMTIPNDCTETSTDERCMVKNTFGVKGIDKWVLVSWSREIESDNKPSKCFDRDCLCVCPQEADLASVCQERGFCAYPDYSLSVSILAEYRKHLSESPVVYDVLHSATFYCIPLSNSLISLSIIRTPRLVSITRAFSLDRDLYAYVSSSCVISDEKRLEDINKGKFVSGPYSGGGSPI